MGRGSLAPGTSIPGSWGPSWAFGTSLSTSPPDPFLPECTPVLLPLVTCPGSSLVTLRNYPGPRPHVLPQGPRPTLSPGTARGSPPGTEGTGPDPP